MTESKFNELFERYSQISDPTERAKISYTLFGKIAADQENNAPDIEKVENSTGENWMAAADRFEFILKNEPNNAFNMALQLVTLPVSPNKKVEDINKWIRGDGPGMLGRKELRNQLLDYLADKEKSKVLINKLDEYVSYDFSKIEDSKTAFEDPGCYLSLSTILLGLKLEENIDSNENVKLLSEKARLKIGDPEVTRVIDYYDGLPDTKWLADELNSFKVK